MKACLTLIFGVSLLFNVFSQQENETIYLLFDNNCHATFETEDGTGNRLFIKKYEKIIKSDFIRFKIDNEKFNFNRKNKIDTCSVAFLRNIKLVDINYLKGTFNKTNEFKHQIFDKIFIIEKISKNRIIRYEVNWIGEMLEIED